MDLLRELSERFAGKVVGLLRAGRNNPFRMCAKLYIEEFRPMLESEYNPSPTWHRQIPWTEDTICAVIDWDKSDWFDSHSSWSPDQPSEMLAHLMPIAMDADYFFKDSQVVVVWKHQLISMMGVIDEQTIRD